MLFIPADDEDEEALPPPWDVPAEVTGGLDAEPFPVAPPEPSPEPTPDAEAAPDRPVAVIYQSRSGGPPHVVTLMPTNPPIVSCTCMAVLSLDRRPKGCHAMVAARSLMGLPPVG